ncbi:MAG: FAD-dependent oxidoreductase [Phycisphaerales bacterium]
MSTPGFDVVIVGGGIAGLWCRWSLVNAGYSVALLERSALAHGQTGASQGILHRGVKYAMSPDASRAAAAADSSAQAWDQAMSGRAGPDLTSVRVLAKSMLMWTDAGILSRITGAVASRLLTSHVERLTDEQIPPLVRAPARAAYRVGETVIDAVSAAHALGAAVKGVMARTAVRSIMPTGGMHRLETECGSIEARAVVLCAGQGNGELLAMLGEDPAQWMQLRDLHMVAARGAPGELFGHWIAAASDKPRLTITSGQDGGVVWYIGGDLAERGVSRSESEQIAAARQELGACFRDLALEQMSFSTIRIARAEGKDKFGKRPDGPVVREVAGKASGGRVFAVWPTKLVMAPVAAAQLLEMLGAVTGPSLSGASLGGCASPDYALPPWVRHR